MTAAHHHLAADSQPELLGIEPAPPVTVIQISTAGSVHHVEVRLSTNGAPHLVIELQAQRGGVPLRAELHGEPGDSPHQFERLAECLRRPGAVAMVAGAGLELVTHHGRHCLHVVACRAIGELDDGHGGAPIPLPLPHHH